MKHLTKYWILPVLLLMFSITAYSQQNIYNWRAGLNVGLMNYYGDIETKFLPNSFDDPMFDKLSYSLEFERKLNRSFGLQASFLYATLTANDIKYKSDGTIDVANSNYKRALNFQSDIRGGSLRLVYHFDNNRWQSWNAKLSPYLFAGFGATVFDVYADLMDTNGNFYYYWSDHTIRDLPESPGNATVSNIIEQDGEYETKLNTLGTENDDAHPDRVLNIPFGIGLKWRISERFNLNVQVDAKYAFSDAIDNISDKYRTSYNSLFQQYAANPTGNTDVYRGNSNGNNDIYLYGSLGLHFNFGEKKKPFKVYPYYSDHGQIAVATPAKVPAEKKIIMKGDTDKIMEFKVSPEDSLLISGDRLETVETIDTLDGKIIKKIVKIELDSLSKDTSAAKKIVIKKRIQNGDSLWVDEKVMYFSGDSINADSLITLETDNIWMTDSGDTLNLENENFDLDVEEELPVRTVEKKISIGARDSLVVIRFKGMDEGELEIDPMLFKQNAMMNDSLADLKQKLNQLRIELDQLKHGVTKDTLKVKKIVSTVKDTTIIKKPITNTVKIDSVKTVKIVTDSIAKPKSVIQRDTLRIVKRDTLTIVKKDTLLIQENVKLKSQLDELRLRNNELQKQSGAGIITKRDTVRVITIDSSAVNENARIKKQIEELNLKNKDLENRLLVAPVQSKKDTVVIIKEVPMPMDRKQADEALQNRIRSQDDRIRSLEGDINSLRSQQQNQVPVQPNINITPGNNDSQNRLQAEVDILKAEIALMKSASVDTATKDSIRVTSTGDTIRVIKSIPTYQDLVKLEKLTELEKKSALQQARIDSLNKVIETEKLNALKSASMKDSLAISNLQSELESLKNQLKADKEKKAEVKAPEENKEKAVVYFASNSSRVISKYYPDIDKVVASAKNDPKLSIILSAFTDASGDPAYNKMLAGKRANAVKNIIVSKGINADRVYIKAVGESEAEEEHDPNSRRVEIKLSVITE